MAFLCLPACTIDRFSPVVSKYRGLQHHRCIKTLRRRLSISMEELKQPPHCLGRETVYLKHKVAAIHFQRRVMASHYTQSVVARPTGNYHDNVWSDEFIQSLETPYGDCLYQERANSLVGKIKHIFSELGDGEISPSAYDTAWVARVPAHDSPTPIPQFPQCITWLLSNQHTDGSWGLQSTFLPSDRLLCTLNSVIALTLWKTGNTHREQGIHFIIEHMKLMKEEHKNSFGPEFETIFPTLLQTAKSMQITLPYDLPYFESLITKHQALLSDISVGDVLHSVPIHMLNTLKGLEEIIDWEKIMRFQSKDGSFLGSPASTACVLIHTGDKNCFDFLNQVVENYEGYVPCLYPIDLLERLQFVDDIERLGIARHFTKDIKVALDYVFRHWSESGIGWSRYNLVGDLNTTALGLLTLRKHGYNVSSEVLKNFKNEDGSFFTYAFQRDTELRSIVNLLRASDIAFPGEEIMDEAKTFAITYLCKARSTPDVSENIKLLKEIEYTLKYRWHESMPRLETRSYLDSYDDNYTWLKKTLYKMPNLSNSYCLDLAKLDFNIIQAVHQGEMKLLSSWRKESGVEEIKFCRHRLVEIYFASAMFEPEYSCCRIAYTKTGYLEVILDDIADLHGTQDELRILTEAVGSWDTSLMDKFPQYMKDFFKIWYGTMNEINAEVLQRQDPVMVEHVKKVWKTYLESYLQEREWLAADYIPTMEEYLKTRLISVGPGPILMQPVLLMGEHLTEAAFQKLYYPSRFFELIGLTWRLANDKMGYKEEKARGELVSSIQCIMEENPGFTEEQALNRVTEMNDHYLKELTLEYFKLGDDIPTCCKKFMFNLRISSQLFYKRLNGFNISVWEIKDYIRKTLLEPVEI